MKDEYFHQTNEILYITENIPTKGTSDLFYDIYFGCQCENECIQDTCACLRYTKNYITENTNDLSSYKLLNRNSPIYECNSSCKCKKYCGNKLVQFGPIPGLQIFECNGGSLSHKGKGLKTSINVNKGTFICEYSGEVLSETEAKIRFEMQEERNEMNYIIYVNEYFGSKKTTTIIDPSWFGNIGRYINHSCDPNCELIPVRVNCTVPKLAVFAKIDVDIGEELTFDYGNENDSIVCGDVKTRKLCLCNSINCKKYLPFCLNM